MRRLSPNELDAYHKDGFVVVPNVFPTGELEEIDREITRLEQEGRSHRNPGWILQLGLRSEKTRDFAQDERILALIEDIVQPGIAIYSAKLTAKEPHSPKVCDWHQDDAYYRRHSESKTRMSVWVPLQDADERNGCLWVIPGSHRWGLEQHTLDDDSQCPKVIEPTLRAPIEEAVPVPVKAGAVVLFSALTWHASRGNETEQVRRAFIVSYQEATVPAGNGAQWKILRPAGTVAAG